MTAAHRSPVARAQRRAGGRHRVRDVRALVHLARTALGACQPDPVPGTRARARRHPCRARRPLATPARRSSPAPASAPPWPAPTDRRISPAPGVGAGFPAAPAPSLVPSPPARSGLSPSECRHGSPPRPPPDPARCARAPGPTASRSSPRRQHPPPAWPACSSGCARNPDPDLSFSRSLYFPAARRRRLRADRRHRRGRLARPRAAQVRLPPGAAVITRHRLRQALVERRW